MAAVNTVQGGCDSTTTTTKPSHRCESSSNFSDGLLLNSTTNEIIQSSSSRRTSSSTSGQSIKERLKQMPDDEFEHLLQIVSTNNTKEKTSEQQEMISQLERKTTQPEESSTTPNLTNTKHSSSLQSLDSSRGGSVSGGGGGSGGGVGGGSGSDGNSGDTHGHGHTHSISTHAHPHHTNNNASSSSTGTKILSNNSISTSSSTSSNSSSCSNNSNSSGGSGGGGGGSGGVGSGSCSGPGGSSKCIKKMSAGTAINSTICNRGSGSGNGNGSGNNSSSSSSSSSTSSSSSGSSGSVINNINLNSNTTTLTNTYLPQTSALGIGHPVYCHPTQLLSGQGPIVPSSSSTSSTSKLVTSGNGSRCSSSVNSSSSSSSSSSSTSSSSSGGSGMTQSINVNFNNHYGNNGRRSHLQHHTTTSTHESVSSLPSQYFFNCRDDEIQGFEGNDGKVTVSNRMHSHPNISQTATVTTTAAGETTTQTSLLGPGSGTGLNLKIPLYRINPNHFSHGTGTTTEQCSTTSGGQGSALSKSSSTKEMPSPNDQGRSSTPTYASRSLTDSGGYPSKRQQGDEKRPKKKDRFSKGLKENVYKVPEGQTKDVDSLVEFIEGSPAETSVTGKRMKQKKDREPRSKSKEKEILVKSVSLDDDNLALVQKPSMEVRSASSTSVEKKIDRSESSSTSSVPKVESIRIGQDITVTSQSPLESPTEFVVPREPPPQPPQTEDYIVVSRKKNKNQKPEKIESKIRGENEHSRGRSEKTRSRGRGSGNDRRKSVGSAPNSEHGSGSDDDSVRSLPAGECTPKECPPKTSSSSGGTPQTSYADIARLTNLARDEDRNVTSYNCDSPDLTINDEFPTLVASTGYRSSHIGPGSTPSSATKKDIDPGTGTPSTSLPVAVPVTVPNTVHTPIDSEKSSTPNPTTIENTHAHENPAQTPAQLQRNFPQGRTEYYNRAYSHGYQKSGRGGYSGGGGGGGNVGGNRNNGRDKRVYSNQGSYVTQNQPLHSTNTHDGKQLSSGALETGSEPQSSTTGSTQGNSESSNSVSTVAPPLPFSEETRDKKAALADAGNKDIDKDNTGTNRGIASVVVQVSSIQAEKVVSSTVTNTSSQLRLNNKSLSSADLIPSRVPLVSGNTRNDSSSVVTSTNTSVNGLPDFKEDKLDREPSVSVTKNNNFVEPLKTINKISGGVSVQCTEPVIFCGENFKEQPVMPSHDIEFGFGVNQALLDSTNSSNIQEVEIQAPVVESSKAKPPPPRNPPQPKPMVHSPKPVIKHIPTEKEGILGRHPSQQVDQPPPTYQPLIIQPAMHPVHPAPAPSPHYSPQNTVHYYTSPPPMSTIMGHSPIYHHVQQGGNLHPMQNFTQHVPAPSHLHNNTVLPLMSSLAQGLISPPIPMSMGVGPQHLGGPHVQHVAMPMQMSMQTMHSLPLQQVGVQPSAYQMGLGIPQYSTLLLHQQQQHQQQQQQQQQQHQYQRVTGSPVTSPGSLNMHPHHLSQQQQAQLNYNNQQQLHARGQIPQLLTQVQMRPPSQPQYVSPQYVNVYKVNNLDNSVMSGMQQHDRNSNNSGDRDQQRGRGGRRGSRGGYNNNMDRSRGSGGQMQGQTLSAQHQQQQQQQGVGGPPSSVSSSSVGSVGRNTPSESTSSRRDSKQSIGSPIVSPPPPALVESPTSTSAPPSECPSQDPEPESEIVSEEGNLPEQEEVWEGAITVNGSDELGNLFVPEEVDAGTASAARQAQQFMDSCAAEVGEKVKKGLAKSHRL